MTIMGHQLNKTCILKLVYNLWGIDRYFSFANMVWRVAQTCIFRRVKRWCLLSVSTVHLVTDKSNLHIPIKLYATGIFVRLVLWDYWKKNHIFKRWQLFWYVQAHSCMKLLNDLCVLQSINFTLWHATTFFLELQWCPVCLTSDWPGLCVVRGPQLISALRIQCMLDPHYLG